MQLKPPCLTLTSRVLVRLAETTSGWSGGRSTLTVLALFAAVVAIDYLSSSTTSVSFLYLAACGVGVWCLGERGGLAISVPGAFAAALVTHSHLLDLQLLHPLSFRAEAWNFAARMISFALVAVVVNGLRGVLALERWRGSHDGLTGALNKVAFEREMRVAVEFARANGRGLVFAYMDLDGFKAINDEHGHSAGDRVLGTFASTAGAAIRETDLFARLGGDEFAALVVLPDATNGMQVAEALHARLTAILAATGFNVTCSMGAVVMTGSEAALDDGVMEQADALMYEAKRSGKNALRVARGSPIAAMLRATYQPAEDGGLEHLLASIDVADRRTSWLARRAA